MEQEDIGAFEHPLFLQYPYPGDEWGTMSRELAEEFDLPVYEEEDFVNLRNIARFYPESGSTFDEHPKKPIDTYRVFTMENVKGELVFIVASIANYSVKYSQDSSQWFQRIVFLRDLSILRD
ncbi:hypothetical protein AAVH_27294 [Aphelenchoides avenae]|nr:hypothetical protein AAVH_27294 [Aphelenchus avenae]